MHIKKQACARDMSTQNNKHRQKCILSREHDCMHKCGATSRSTIADLSSWLLSVWRWGWNRRVPSFDWSLWILTITFDWLVIWSLTQLKKGSCLKELREGWACATCSSLLLRPHLCMQSRNAPSWRCFSLLFYILVSCTHTWFCVGLKQIKWHKKPYEKLHASISFVQMQ